LISWLWCCCDDSYAARYVLCYVSRCVEFIVVMMFLLLWCYDDYVDVVVMTPMLHVVGYVMLALVLSSLWWVNVAMTIILIVDVLMTMLWYCSDYVVVILISDYVVLILICDVMMTILICDDSHAARCVWCYVNRCVDSVVLSSCCDGYHFDCWCYDDHLDLWVCGCYVNVVIMLSWVNGCYVDVIMSSWLCWIMVVIMLSWVNGCYVNVVIMLSWVCGWLMLLWCYRAHLDLWCWFVIDYAHLDLRWLDHLDWSSWLVILICDWLCSSWFVMLWWLCCDDSYVARCVDELMLWWLCCGDHLDLWWLLCCTLCVMLC